MNELRYTITLSDGTEITNLKMNGNNFVSSTPIYEDKFVGKLSHVVFSNGEQEWTYDNLKFVQIQVIDDEYYFVFAQITNEEMLFSDVDYLAMMTGISIDRSTEIGRLMTSSIYSLKYEKVLKYYKTGLWDIYRVRASVGKWITEFEFEEITGYPE